MTTNLNPNRYAVAAIKRMGDCTDVATALGGISRQAVHKWKFVGIPPNRKDQIAKLWPDVKVDERAWSTGQIGPYTRTKRPRL